MVRILPNETDIYALTDSKFARGRSVEEQARALLGAGVKILQYREKHAKAGVMLEECRLLARLCREAGACFIVNDHIDIALLVDADGVHIGQRDFPPAIARRILGPDTIIGFSCSNLEEVRATDESLVDYLGLGPVFPTQTKTDAAPAMSLDGLAVCAAATSLPVVAIGGINAANASAVRAAGPHIGLAVVSAICAASDPRRAAEALR